MRKSNEQSLAEALRHLIDAAGMREKMDELDIGSWWDEVVGGLIARHTTGLRLNKGKLYVKVDSAPLRQELTYMRERIAQLLNQRMGREVVKEIILS